MIDVVQAELLLRELVTAVEEACGPDVWYRDDWHDDEDAVVLRLEDVDLIGLAARARQLLFPIQGVVV